MSLNKIALSALVLSVMGSGQALNCNFTEYKALDGLKAEMRSGSLELTWQG